MENQLQYWESWRNVHQQDTCTYVLLFEDQTPLLASISWDYYQIKGHLKLQIIKIQKEEEEKNVHPYQEK